MSLKRRTSPCDSADFFRDWNGDVRKLYEGYVVSVAGIIPFRAIYFIVNDTLRAILPWIRDELCGNQPVRWVHPTILH